MSGCKAIIDFVYLLPASTINQLLLKSLEFSETMLSLKLYYNSLAHLVDGSELTKSVAHTINQQL